MATSDSSIYLDYGPPLPEGHWVNQIAVLVRDPDWLFAYWEVQIDPGAEESVTMRVHDLSRGDAIFIPVRRRLGSWYVPARPYTEYELEIGLLQKGQFIALAKSPRIKTPPTGSMTRLGSSKECSQNKRGDTEEPNAR